MKVVESFAMLTFSVFNRNCVFLSVVQLLKGIWTPERMMSYSTELFWFGLFFNVSLWECFNFILGRYFPSIIHTKVSSTWGVIVLTTLFRLQSLFLSLLMYFSGLRKLHVAKLLICKVVNTHLAFVLHLDTVHKSSLLNIWVFLGYPTVKRGVSGCTSALSKVFILLNLVEIWKSCTNT